MPCGICQGNDHNRRTCPKSEAKKYANGKIYRLIFDNKCIYIGSTIQTLEKRLQGHRNSSIQKARWSAEYLSSPIYTFIREVGSKNIAIELYEKFPCKSKEELEYRETSIIESEQKINPHLKNAGIPRRDTRPTEEDRKRELERRKYEEEHKEEVEALRYQQHLSEIKRRQELLDQPPPQWFLNSQMHNHIGGIEKLIEQSTIKTLRKLAKSANVNIKSTDKKDDIVDKVKAIYKPRGIVSRLRFQGPGESQPLNVRCLTMKDICIAAASFGVFKRRLDYLTNSDPQGPRHAE